jgi:hypothetical protein
MHTTPVRERGSGTLSYLALGVLAAVILGTLVASGVGDRFAGGAGAVVCRTVQAGGPCGARPVARAPVHGGTADGTGGDKPPAGHKKGGGCHGFLGCTWSGAKSVGGGAWSAVKDTGSGLKSLVTTNPVTTGKGLGTFAWRESPVGQGVRAWKACGAGRYAECGDAVFCATTANGCLVRDMVIDDKTRDDLAKGHWGDATGRVLWNGGSLLIPTKIPGLSKLGGAGKAAKGAEDAGDAAKAGRVRAPVGGGDDPTLSLGNAEKQLQGIRRARGDAVHLSPSGIKDIAEDFRGLGPAERTRFLDQLALSELADIWGYAPKIDANLRADLMRSASPRMLQFLDGHPPFAESGGWYDFPGDLWRDSGPTRWDIKQGGVGTCWCLASMGALADQAPGTLERLFTKNPNGTYTVTFGDGVRVTVSRELPRDGAFVEHEAGWPALLEKAIAVREGGYDAVNGGRADHALHWLSGKPVTTYTAINRDMPTAREIAAHLANHDAMVLSIDKGTKLKGLRALEKMADRGIFDYHAYTVIEADPAAKTITLANPHGPSAPEITLTEKEYQKIKGMNLDLVPTR